jgi:hypothetical protein
LCFGDNNALTSEDIEIIQYRCEKCNAPYPLGADDVIATCPYCGFTYELDKGEIEHYIVPNKLDKDSIVPFFKKWLESASSKAVGRITTNDIEDITPMLEWIPAFRVEGSYSSRYSGYGTAAEESLIFPVEGSNTGRMTEWILARRRAVTYGMNRFVESLRDSRIVEFQIEMAKEAPVLNSEISAEDASSRFQKSSKDRDRESIEGVVLDHHFEVTVESVAFVHVPYWLVRYTYRKGTFRVAISGATGEVLFGELPVTTKYRAKKWIAAILTALLAALLFQAAPYTALLLGGEGGAEGATVLLLFTGLVMAFIPFLVKELFVYEVEVDNAGRETREWLGDERVE